MKILIPILVVFVSLIPFTLFGQNKDSEEIIKIETSLVSVPVIVSDRNGRYIPDLRIEDFSVFQDDKRQQISFFANKEEPLNVAILLDTSLSTSQVIDKIKKAAIEFVYQLQPRDRASIVTFDSDVNLIRNLTSERIKLENSIRNVEIGYNVGTVMRDAVMEVVQEMFKDVKGRKAIIILTDGKDFGSYYLPSNVLKTLEESDVLIYSVFYKTEMGNANRRRRGRFGRNRGRINSRRARMEQRQKRMNKEAADYLESMSKLTAGRFYKKKISDLKKTFSLITSELRNQYRLGYYPQKTSTAGTLHKIKVKVSKKKVAVRSRETYRIK